jgi:predicted alpha/beta hydrolase family esterase
MEALMDDGAATLILPGRGNSGPEHWQSQWERRDRSCHRVLQGEWDTPTCATWIARLDEVIAAQPSAVVLAAHSLACALVAHWAAMASAGHLARVHGALLVAPSDPDGPNYPAGPTGFVPIPFQRLPFASIVVASSDDPYVTPARAQQYADAWNSRFVLLENAGHINVASGFGAWSEGYTLLSALRSTSPEVA